MKITVIRNNKIENFDLKEIYLKNKDLSKIFQRQNHLARKKHKHLQPWYSIMHTFFFLSFVYIL